jgi:hypothetical protein
MNHFGKTLIVIGCLFIVVGVILMFIGRVPLLGKLPGDITIQKKNVTFYFPLSTSIVISIVLTILLTLFFKFRGK